MTPRVRHGLNVAVQAFLSPLSSPLAVSATFLRAVEDASPEDLKAVRAASLWLGTKAAQNDVASKFVSRTTDVRRKCPRCGHFAMQLANIVTHEITCSGGCGHRWQGRLTAIESGDADMNAEDWDALSYIARGSGAITCSGSKGRMTLAQAKRLELHGHVKITRPEKDRYSGERPNRSWQAEVTETGRKALGEHKAGGA